jgi:hypothetical protein
MFYELWIYPLNALFLVLMYWSSSVVRGHFVAGVVTVALALFLSLLLFSSQLMDLIGSRQWLVLTLVSMVLMTWFVNWFSNKYGKPLQKK